MPGPRETPAELAAAVAEVSDLAAHEAKVEAMAARRVVELEADLFAARQALIREGLERDEARAQLAAERSRADRLREERDGLQQEAHGQREARDAAEARLRAVEAERNDRTGDVQRLTARLHGVEAGAEALAEAAQEVYDVRNLSENSRWDAVTRLERALAAYRGSSTGERATALCPASNQVFRPPHAKSNLNWACDVCGRPLTISFDGNGYWYPAHVALTIPRPARGADAESRCADCDHEDEVHVRDGCLGGPVTDCACRTFKAPNPIAVSPGTARGAAPGCPPPGASAVPDPELTEMVTCEGRPEPHVRGYHCHDPAPAAERAAPAVRECNEACQRADAAEARLHGVEARAERLAETVERHVASCEMPRVEYGAGALWRERRLSYDSMKAAAAAYRSASPSSTGERATEEARLDETNGVVCDRCDGAGTLLNGVGYEEVCPKCGGPGYVAPIPASPGTARGAEEASRCADCDHEEDVHVRDGCLGGPVTDCACRALCGSAGPTGASCTLPAGHPDDQCSGVTPDGCPSQWSRELSRIATGANRKTAAHAEAGTRAPREGPAMPGPYPLEFYPGPWHWEPVRLVDGSIAWVLNAANGRGILRHHAEWGPAQSVLDHIAAAAPAAGAPREPGES